MADKRKMRGFDGIIYGKARLTVDEGCLLELLNILLELGEYCVCDFLISSYLFSTYWIWNYQLWN